MTTATHLSIGQVDRGVAHVGTAAACPVCGPADPQPARPIIDGANTVDLICDALGHLAGSLYDTERPNPDAYATATQAARLQQVLAANRTTLGQVLAGVAPALTMTEQEV